MNCPACQRHLTAYIDDEVAAELRHEMETHMDDCQACRTELETHQASVEAVNCIDIARGRRDLWEDIAAKLAPREGAATEDLALMIRGLARQVDNIERSLAVLREEFEEEEAHIHAFDRADIRVRSKPFSTSKIRPASTPATIEQLRQSS